MGIGGESVARDLAINFCPAFPGMFKFFDDANSRAFAHDKAIAVAIERAGGALRFVVAFAERSHRGKAGEAEFDDGSFRAAGQKNIRVTEFDDAPRFAEAMAS